MAAASLLSHVTAGQADAEWVPSWGAAQQRLDPESELTSQQLTDATVRQAVRLSIGGKRIRIVLSNMAAGKPLTVAGVHVARSGTPGDVGIAPGSDHIVLFTGKGDVTIPAGQEIVSDPVDLALPALTRLSISMRYLTPPEPQTGHLRALSSTWLAHGDQLSATALADASETKHWYQLAAVQVEVPNAHVIVAFGDSITDGSGSTPNTNARWPYMLAERLQAIRGIGQWSIVRVRAH